MINNAKSQWVQCGPIYFDGTSICLAYINGNILTGTGGGIYVSSNNGNSFTRAVYSDSNYNRSVSGLTVNGVNVFASHSYGGVWVSYNNGLFWTETWLAGDIVSIGSGYGFVLVGRNLGTGGVWITANNGLNWTQSSMTTQIVASFTSANNYFFAGTNDEGVWRSTNYGFYWTQTTPLGAGIVASLASGGNDIYAGLVNTNPGTSGVMLSTNFGSSWFQRGLTDIFVYSLAVTGNYIFAGTQSNGVYMSSNNGANWLTINSGFQNISRIYALLIADNYIYAGTDNRVWRRPLSELIGVGNISSDIPFKYSLFQNYPNPFNPVTKIGFSVPKTSYVKISVFDNLGKEVDVLVNQQLQPGTYEVDWNSQDSPSGVYYYKIQSGSFTETKKMLKVR